MSTLNFLQTSEHEAAVMVDTNTTIGGEASKMLPLPHLGAILAGRGRAFSLVLMASDLLMHCSSFDAAFDAVVDHFVRAQHRLAALDRKLADAMGVELAALPSRAAGLSEEIILVGWSRRSDCVRAVSVAWPSAGGEVAVDEDLTACVAPADAEVLALLQNGPLSDEKALTAMRKQHAPFDDPASCGLGGRLLLGTVRRGEVSVRDLGPL